MDQFIWAVHLVGSVLLAWAASPVNMPRIKCGRSALWWDGHMLILVGTIERKSYTL